MPFKDSGPTFEIERTGSITRPYGYRIWRASSLFGEDALWRASSLFGEDALQVRDKEWAEFVRLVLQHNETMPERWQLRPEAVTNA